MRIALFILTSVVLALCPASEAVRAQTLPATQPSDSFQAQLTQIDLLASKIQSLQAIFVQAKVSPLVIDPIVTTGTIRAIPAIVLWESSKPEPIKTRIDAKQLSIYYPKQNTVEVFDFDPAMSGLTASPLPRLAAVRESFKLSEDAGEGLALPADGKVLVVRLDPLAKPLSQYVDHLRIVLDVERGLVLAFELTDPDGEVTTTTFSDVQTNADLTADDLNLNTPPDVKVVHPAEGMR